MPRGNCERVACLPDGRSQTADTTVAKVVRVNIGRVVYLVVGDAFDITWPAQLRVDRHRVATRRAARVGECVGFVRVRSWKTTARAGLAATGTRAAVPADTIGLRWISGCELAERDLLILTAGTGRDCERDRLASARVSQVK